MPLPISDLSERDIAMFSSPAPVQKTEQNHGRSKAAEPAKYPATPSVTPMTEQEESIARKNKKAWASWKKTFVAYATSAIVGLCLFGAVITELNYLQAVSEQQALYKTLDQLQQEAITHESAIEQKYSLDVIQEYATTNMHMVPMEGSRIFFVSHNSGDKVLK